MEQLDPDVRPSDPSSSAGPTAPARVRFRVQSQPGRTETQRRWQAAYAVGEEWRGFGISIDLGRGTCTFYRTAGQPLAALLQELSEQAAAAAPLSTPSRRLESLQLDAAVVGLRMPKVETVADRAGGAGDWLVVQVYLPGSAQSFLLGLNSSQGAGEIAVPTPDVLPAVVHTLAEVLG